MVKTISVLCLITLFCAHSLAEEVVATNSGDPSYAKIEPLVAAAINDGQMPGAVVVVANKSKVLFARAFGHRQLEPVAEPMTLNTVFDLASITKPVATATSVMKLVQQGKIDVGAAVSSYLPEFSSHDKNKILVSDLLLHISGLVPDNALADYRNGPQQAWRRICELKPRSQRGERFAYSDVGFIVLGKLVQRISELPLDQFAKQEIFLPLGMEETSFNPGPQLSRRAAATEQRDGNWIKGEVHDPRAFLLGGVAGHAGLFSTAADLLKYSRALLAAAGESGSAILSNQTLETMIAPRDILRGTRTYGWDHRSPYSKNRGQSFSDQAFGHGGFTGTVLWIDPAKELVFIFLSTRLHPDGKGSVNDLAGELATLIAADN